MTHDFPPPVAPPPYQPPYPVPYSGLPRPVTTGPPGTVWAAVIITYVMAGLSILMTFVLLVFAAFVGSVIGDAFTRDDQIGLSLIILAMAAVSFVLNVAACYLAWKTSRRRQWARIALIVWAAVFALVGVLSLSPPGFLWTAGGAAVVVLLLVPESSAWFDREKSQIAREKSEIAREF